MEETNATSPTPRKMGTLERIKSRKGKDESKMDQSMDSLGNLTKSMRSLSRGGSSSKSLKSEPAGREFVSHLAGKPILELSLACTNLPKLDLFGLSDPFVVMYILRDKGDVQKLGKTETVWYTLNPTFVRVFDLPLDTPRSALLKCDVYDRDHYLDDLNRHDYIGRVQVTFEELLAAKSGNVQKNLINDDTRRPWKVQPVMTFHVTKMQMPLRSMRWELQLKFSPNFGVPKKNTKFFFMLYRSDNAPEHGKQMSFPHALYRSEAVGLEHGLNFADAVIPVERVQINGRDRVLRMDILEYKKKGAHVVHASTDMAFRDILMLSAGNKVDLKSRKGEKAGSMACTKSLRGEGSNGKVYTTTLEIQEIVYE
mmetsp:Transcript_3256/g.9945  ORF Transcript_3256/g.9945 Transcript_3256/m.9945 type:complete len:368 (+) Transcript_3256:124-1227(+)